MNDDTVELEIELTDEEFLIIARLAHKKNITINQLCVNILEEYVNKECSENV